MASIKVKFRPSTVADREGTIYYQIIQDRTPRQLHTDYRVFASEWNPRHSKIIVAQRSDRTALLAACRDRIRRDVERLTKIVRIFDNSGAPYTADDIIDEFNRYCREYSLFHFMGNIIDMLHRNGKFRTSETYGATLNSFRKFRGGDDIMLDSIDSETMEAYEAWLSGRGVSPNTISFYTRILRAVYNRAVDNEIIENRYPFRRVYTGIDKTVKRALPLPFIKKIKALELSLSPELDYARDMFLLSFMLRGMSFIDMAYLRKTDLADGYVTYRRRKTGQQLVIEWTKDMQRILNKYKENTSGYLLPIIRRPGLNERSTYKRVGNRINHALKRIARMVGITAPLTLYVARHSWASIAKSRGVPLGVISAGMGHDSEATTQIYLASLDTSAVDRANSMILRLI